MIEGGFRWERGHPVRIERAARTVLRGQQLACCACGRDVRAPSNKTMISLHERQRSEMRQHGERDYPFECCGLMLGRFEGTGRKNVSETYAISNAREEEAKRNRFLIRPEELMRGEKYAREKGLDVVGFYHSHPDDHAVPSKYDLDHAWPTYSYIVVSVEKGQAVELRSWEMEADRSKFNEEEISPSPIGSGPG